MTTFTPTEDGPTTAAGDPQIQGPTVPPAVIPDPTGVLTWVVPAFAGIFLLFLGTTAFAYHGILQAAPVQGLRIGQALPAGATNATARIVNPATGEVMQTVPLTPGTDGVWGWEGNVNADGPFDVEFDYEGA